MFFKSGLLLTLVAPLVSALTLDTPTGWTSQATETITWTSAPGDPPLFSFELINEAFHDAFAIANNVDVSLNSLTLTLPVVPARDGYTLQAVDTGNITNVFASTQSFSIGAVTSGSSTGTSTGSVSGTGTTSNAATFTPQTTSAFGTTGTPTAIPTNAGASSSSSPTSTASGFSGASALKFGASSMGAVGVLLLAAIAGGVVAL